jgi:fructosamine-3-kinase
MLPAELAREVEAALAAHFGSVEKLSAARPVGGGCISHAARLRTAGGAQAFLKYGVQGEFPLGIFAAEARSLAVLLATGAVRVPYVIAASDTAGTPFTWLLLEWLEPGQLTRESAELLGRSLANLHRCTHDLCGWFSPNFIGSLPQSNEWSAAWPAFWRDQRIVPQLEAAALAGALRAAERARIRALLDQIDHLLQSDDGHKPSLLHGDLWAGNVHAVATGEPALIDPACYYGHREVDLAMAALFGGFNRRFFEAYDEVWVRPPGYEQRRLVYQLYYLLVHVNLFGRSYLASTMSVVGELGF